MWVCSSNDNKKITTKGHLLINNAKDFFEGRPNDWETFISIVSPENGEKKISIRSIEWLVSSYSREKNIKYRIRRGQQKVIFHMNSSYVAKMDSVKKKYFDPFCRKGKISLMVNNRVIQTSVAQLHFFHWALTNKVIEYAIRFHKKIEYHRKTKSTGQKVKCSKKIVQNHIPESPILSGDNLLDLSTPKEISK